MTMSFKQLREKTKGMPAGEHVYDKTVNRHKVMVHKDKKGFTVYIDGDKLETFKTQKDAQEAGIEFAKEM